MKFFSSVVFLLLSLFSMAQNDSSHYFKSFDQTRIYYEDKGSGYPIILIHGFLNTSQNWKRTSVYDDLLRTGFRTIIIDLRGNGKSDKPHSEKAYSGDAEAKDIIALVSSLNIQSYNVVGYSRGSIIAARLLALDKRIRKAVLGGMGTDFTNPEWPRRKMFYHVLNGDTTVQELEPLIKRLQTDSSLDRQALTLQQKEQPSTPMTVLQTIRQPVLVLCGEEDPDKEKAHALSLLFRKGSFAIVPGDHGFAVTTKEFAKMVLLFLSGDGQQF